MEACWLIWGKQDGVGDACRLGRVVGDELG